jgi:hypothetical protein
MALLPMIRGAETCMATLCRRAVSDQATGALMRSTPSKMHAAPDRSLAFIGMAHENGHPSAGADREIAA